MFGVCLSSNSSKLLFQLASSLYLYTPVNGPAYAIIPAATKQFATIF